MDDLFNASLFGGGAFPDFDVRGDDYYFTTCLDFFKIWRNEGKIYRALLSLDKNKGGANREDGIRAIRVGYTELVKVSGCSTRALGRAWPRLKALGFLVERKKHEDRRSARYTIRTIELLDSLYMSAGCTHFRVMRDRSLQPFRAKKDLELAAQ
jgi:hypothetical protein